LIIDDLFMPVSSFHKYKQFIDDFLLSVETKNVPKFEGTKGIAKPDNTQPEGTQAETIPEARQRESSLQLVQEQPPENPLLGFLGIVGVAASGVLGGLYGTSLQEEKALQSIVSSVNHLQTCS
jgi:hypothetical protein